MKKFFVSYWFNIVLGILAAFFGVMQEVWINSGISKLETIAFGIFASIGFSFGAEMAKMFNKFYVWSWRDILFGGTAGLIIAVLTGLIFI